MNTPKKIFILGTSGSGKTTLAKKLSKHLKIAHYDLDDIFWINKYDKKLPRYKRKIKLKKLVKKSKWIIEGVYGSWTGAAIRESEIIIWLLPGRLTLSKRLILRGITREKEIKNKVIGTYHLWRYMMKYYNSDKSSGYLGHLKITKRYKKKLVIIKKNGDLKILNSIFGKII